MGASHWTYRIAATTRPSEALSKLREDTWRNGCFRAASGLSTDRDLLEDFVGRSLSGLTEDEFLGLYVAACPPGTTLDERNDAALRELFHEAASAAVDGPDAVVLESGPNGTHSILDIRTYVDEQVDSAEDVEHACAAMLTRAATARVFGTERPTRSDVEGKLDVLAAMCPRWRCLCVPVYEGDAVVEWVFAGCSGD